MNQAIHVVDLLQWFAGPVATITAEVDTLCHEKIEVEDTAAALLRFKNHRALGVIEATTSAYPGFKRRIEIHGDKGVAIAEDSDFTTWDFEDSRPEDDEIRKKFAVKASDTKGAADPTAISYDNHRLQLQNVVDVLDGKAGLTLDGREGRKAVEIILGIYQSAKTGQMVRL